MRNDCGSSPRRERPAVEQEGAVAPGGGQRGYGVAEQGGGEDDAIEVTQIAEGGEVVGAEPEDDLTPLAAGGRG